MSKINDINKVFGNTLRTSIANTTVDEVLKCTVLPANTLIISAPEDENGNDQSISLVMTDYNGVPVRLTYAISEGNGLYSENDKLKLYIDDTTLIGDSELTINFDNIINKDSLTSNQNKLSINTSYLQIANNTDVGIAAIDEKTISLNSNSEIYVNTDNLDKAGVNMPGVCKPDNYTIISYNGILSVNTQNLNKASDKEFGVVKDNDTNILINNGILTVIPDKLEYADKISFGLIKGVNDSTIKVKNGIVSINSNNMKKANYDNFGVAMFDEDIFTTSDGVVNITNYNKVLEYINKCKAKINSIKIQLA